MRKTATGYQFSATDLSIYLSCAHAIRLEKELKDEKRSKPPYFDAGGFVVKQLGLEHERRFVEHLKDKGFSIVELPSLGNVEDDTARTIDAMKAGLDFIVQATFDSPLWHGRADILMKVDKPSLLGTWSYQVMDTKLAQETKAGMVLQLCVYSDLLSQLQGVLPEKMHVVKPGDPFVYEDFRFDDYAAYYRWIKKKLEVEMQTMDTTSSYPDPVPFCDTCRWFPVCDQQRRKDDHLTFVAGLHNSHSKELHTQGLNTLKSFAHTEEIQRPQKGSLETYLKLQRQAKIQYNQMHEGVPKHELLPFVQGEGLSRLPKPDAGDIFFDIEGDRFYKDGSIEYLLGLVYMENDAPVYKTIWAFDRKHERMSFDSLMAFFMQRLNDHPGMHIYHFGHYETDAVKHMMLRHSLWAEELDKLLRGERFVDLHSILKQSVRAGVESYSLKNMEAFYGYVRKIPLADAARALRVIQRVLELDLIGQITKEDQDHVALYNQDDCLSTNSLRDWLEQQREQLIADGNDVNRPQPKPEEPKEKLAARIEKILSVQQPLLAMLPEDQDKWSAEDEAIKLLSNLLDYFRREEKNFWWEYYRINELEPDELIDERNAIYGLQFIDELPLTGKTKIPVQRYRYPPQEFSTKDDVQLDIISSFDDERIKLGDIVEHDYVSRIIHVKKTGKTIHLHPVAVQVNDFIGPRSLEPSLLTFAKNILEDGLQGTGKYKAGRELLLRTLPRFKSNGTSLFVDTNVAQSAIALSVNLDSSLLAIQGPPGTGKTYNGAQIISTLHEKGKRIGVTAVSHKAIDNLLEWVDRIAKENGRKVPIAHRGDTDPDYPMIEYIAAEHVEDCLDNNYVVGGTAFLWSTDTMEEKLDYLFIDEAGQMSLAYALAVSRCAKNLILLGDPQQLDQPQKAAHPDGADVSALQHYIGAGHQVIERDRGLFLDTTWRSHPRICDFTSLLFYEGKLKARPGLEYQIVLNNPHFGNHPLVYIPVVHYGNTNNSPEEVEAIATIVDQLLTQGTIWREVGPKKTEEKLLTVEEIKIIAPYNAQVSALKRRLPGLPIGTVDKFQGQEAAVVIYSMTSSSAEDAPRGMSFLYLPNRLNVASSRAQCLFILVASPKLLEPDCKTPEQMKMANGLCAFREMT